MSSTSILSATFNDFLFATVCDERGDMPLSVISALARLDLDPWTEAAELARMPAEGAARRLSFLLAAVVSAPPAQPDRATTAARLVGLLPVLAKTDVPPYPRPVGGLTALQLRAMGLMCLAFLASLAISAVIANLAPGAVAPGSASSAIASTAAARR